MAAIRFGDNNRNHVVMSNKDINLNRGKDPIKLDVNEGDALFYYFYIRISIYTHIDISI
jgi:hypothetical protein